MLRTALVALCLALPSASAQTGFRLHLPDADGATVHAALLSDAADLPDDVVLVAVLPADAALRGAEGGLPSAFFLSAIGYAAGAYAGYHVGFLTEPFADQVFSVPGVIGGVLLGSVGSAVGAHYGSRPRGRLEYTTAGALLAQGLVLAAATLPYGGSGSVVGPAVLASPFVAVGTSVTLEWIYGRR